MNPIKTKWRLNLFLFLFLLISISLVSALPVTYYGNIIIDGNNGSDVDLRVESNLEEYKFNFDESYIVNIAGTQSTNTYFYIWDEKVNTEIQPIQTSSVELNLSFNKINDHDACVGGNDKACSNNNCLYDICKPNGWECYDNSHCSGYCGSDHKCKTYSGGGGGSGYFGPNIYNISTADLVDGISRTLNVDDQIIFYIDGEEHIITILEITEDYVIFEVRSDIQEFTLDSGEDVDVDVTGDGYTDVNIKLSDITAANRAVITVKEDRQAVPSVVEVEESPEEEQIETVIEVEEEKEPFTIPYQEEISKFTGAVAGVVGDEPEISFGLIAVIILVIIALIVTSIYGGFPLPLKSRFDRATYFHRKAEIEYRKGNHNKSHAFHRKAQRLREEAERRKRH